MMKLNEFLEKIKKIPEVKTLYVMGGWGQPLTDANKKRLINGHAYNQNADRKKMINAASADTFAFDCVCMIKAVLWEFDFDTKAANGGAVYASNGVPDINADQMIEKCSGVSVDFSNITPGEVVWKTGHIGVYIGNGLAVECTPAWKNCAQVTAVGNIGAKSGYESRTWMKHGKLPYVDYTKESLNGWVHRNGDWFYYVYGKPITGKPYACEWQGKTDWYIFDKTGRCAAKIKIY